MKLTKEQMLIARLANGLAQLVGMHEAALAELDISMDSSEFMRLTQEAAHFIQNNQNGSTVSDRVYISDHRHIAAIGQLEALSAIQDAMQGLIGEYPQIAGIKLAKTMIDGITAEARLESIRRNLVIASKGGLDISKNLYMRSDAGGFFLTNTQDDPK